MSDQPPQYPQQPEQPEQPQQPQGQYQPQQPQGQYQPPQYPQQPQGQYQQPQYQQPYPQQPPTVIVQQKKGPPWLLIILGILGLCVLSCALVFIFTTFAARSAVDALATAIPASGTAGAATTEAIERLPASSANAVGSSAETAGLRITLNEVRRSQGGEVFKPKEGYEYVILNLTFENIDNEEHTVSSLLSAKVVDDTGQRYTIALGADTEDIPDGTIAAGDRSRGELAFEVPTDATGLVYIYDPLFGGEPVRFKLDR